MHRVQLSAPTEAIAIALDRLPLGIRCRVSHARFFVGVDPIFAGLHDTTTTLDDRSYRTTAHVCYPWHLEHRPLAERVSTVVLPSERTVEVVVHELGHVLHETIDFDCHVPRPVTAYAAMDEWEAFAEAFTAWICPTEYRAAAELLAGDEQTLTLFSELAT